MFRLAHISDVHLSPIPEPSWRDLASKRITGYVNWHKNRAGSDRANVLSSLITHLQAAKPDHIAITGDVVNIATRAEIDAAEHWLNTLGDPQNVSLVLGNHDAYTREGLNKALVSWRQWMSSDDGSPSFPYLRTRGDVAIIGCNSGVVSPPFSAIGRFEKPQAALLKKMLEQAAAEGLFRIVKIHHPPFENATHHHKRLIGDKLFRETIKKAGAELILHGHTHKDTFKWIDGPDTINQVPVICVPSASQPPTNTGTSNVPAARYNLFNISGKKGSWNCTMRAFGYTDKDSPISEIRKQKIY